MSLRQGGFGGVGVAVALGLGASFAAVPASVSGQIGALSAVSAAVAGATGETVFAGAPVLGESGLILADGWAATASVTGVEWAGTVFSELGGEVDWALGFNNVAVGGVYAVGEGRAMVGASMSIFSGTELMIDGRNVPEAEASGLGDLSLYGKAKLAESADGRMQAAAFARVGVPTGAEEVSAGAASFGGGLGVSSRINDKTSVHGSVGFGYQGVDGGDGYSSLNFTGAVVGRVGEKAWVSGEVLATRTEGQHVVNVGPAVRFRAGENFFVDIGGVVKALASEETLPLDYGVVIGATYVPRIGR